MTWLQTTALAAMLLCGCASVFAHEVRPAIATVAVDADGSVEVAVALNLEAALTGIGTAHDNTSDSPQAGAYDHLRALPSGRLTGRARGQAAELAALFNVTTDRGNVTLSLDSIAVPDGVDPSLARISTLAFTGQLPAGASAFHWQVAADIGDSVIRRRAPGSDAVVDSEFVLTGDRSRSFAVADGPRAGGLEVFASYLQVGFVHIVPRGLDHILFVVGLFLVSTQLGPLLAQITAFTLAHTVTLGMAMAGVISLPASIVEPLIAASIVYVAVENMMTSRVHAWRLALVFAFGLLHGLGFAGVLAEIGPATDRFVLSLVAFNVGVEIGQLAVIGLCVALLGWTARRSWRRTRVVMPLSLGIALVGLYWLVERVGLLPGGLA